VLLRTHAFIVHGNITELNAQTTESCLC
jgi:hypothetical protein